MPLRSTPLVTDQYYHIFNRGVAKLPTFQNKREYSRFLLTLEYYQFRPVPTKFSRLANLSGMDRSALFAKLNEGDDRHIRILCYCLMPNHFHLLVQQKSDHGISTFMNRLQNSYTKYINTKNGRVGPLFQGSFKAVLIDSDNLLLHVSRYIHLNPLMAFLVDEKHLLTYPWSSFSQYTETINHSLIDTTTILSYFKSPIAYKKFVFDQIEYAKSLSSLKYLNLEDEKPTKIPEVA